MISSLLTIGSNEVEHWRTTENEEQKKFRAKCKTRCKLRKMKIITKHFLKAIPIIKLT